MQSLRIRLEQIMGREYMRRLRSHNMSAWPVIEEGDLKRAAGGKRNVL